MADEPSRRETAPGERLTAEVELLGRMKAAAGPDAFLPFDRFMDLALYAPRLGFYSQATPRLGPSGDFYTAAHVHPIFSEAVATRIREVFFALDRPVRFRIVELGPGDGTLAEGVLRALSPVIPEGGAWEYVLVERSASLAQRAVERLAAFEGKAPIEVRVASNLGADGPFAGAVVANEFLDAQPVRRLIYREEKWLELGVSLEENGLVWREMPLVLPVPGPKLPTRQEEGTVLEVSPAAEAVVRELGDHLVGGLALLIDYGLEETELLRTHPRGTLAAVRQHRSMPNVLEGVGQNDLSAFVNFSRIRASASAAGLREIRYTSQSEALVAWGIAQRLEEAVGRARSSEEEVRTRLAAKNLLFGFESFRVLELSPPASEKLLRPSEVK